VNGELAMASLADAKASPASFDMNSFFSSSRTITKEADGFQPPPCGTTACYAGFVSLRVAPKGSKIVNGRVIEPDDTRTRAGYYAQKALGLTEDQADVLFYLSNVEQVEKAVTHLAVNPDADFDGIWEAAHRG
jgi:hypothetical protein